MGRAGGRGNSGRWGQRMLAVRSVAIVLAEDAPLSTPPRVNATLADPKAFQVMMVTQKYTDNRQPASPSVHVHKSGYWCTTRRCATREAAPEIRIHKGNGGLPAYCVRAGGVWPFEHFPCGLRILRLSGCSQRARPYLLLYPLPPHHHTRTTHHRLEPYPIQTRCGLLFTP